MKIGKQKNSVSLMRFDHLGALFVSFPNLDVEHSSGNVFFGPPDIPLSESIPYIQTSLKLCVNPG